MIRTTGAFGLSAGVSSVPLSGASGPGAWMKVSIGAAMAGWAEAVMAARPAASAPAIAFRGVRFRFKPTR